MIECLCIYCMIELQKLTKPMVDKKKDKWQHSRWEVLLGPDRPQPSHAFSFSCVLLFFDDHQQWISALSLPFLVYKDRDILLVLSVAWVDSHLSALG